MMSMPFAAAEVAALRHAHLEPRRQPLDVRRKDVARRHRDAHAEERLGEHAVGGGRARAVDVGEADDEVVVGGHGLSLAEERSPIRRHDNAPLYGAWRHLAACGRDPACPSRVGRDKPGPYPAAIAPLRMCTTDFCMSQAVGGTAFGAEPAVQADRSSSFTITRSVGSEPRRRRGPARCSSAGAIRLVRRSFLLPF